MYKLRIKHGEFTLYQAGLPNFPRNFARDSIISAILMQNSKMLGDQLSFCALRQGVKKNPRNGEEPGKIFHEYPGFKIRGLSTEFNACDTTALYLIGHQAYQKLTSDKSLANKQEKNIKSAAGYILSHLDNGLFVESPRFCGAKRFAAKVTYWKDSEIIDRAGGQPIYPVVYPLAHIQNMCGLRSAAKLLNSKELGQPAGKMKKALKKLCDKDLGAFFIAIDKKGAIRGINSDSLHALFYLEPRDLSREMLKEIVKSSAVLETPIGYRTLDPCLSEKVEDKYHADTVWPFEQAIINIGARKFGLKRIEEVSSRIKEHLDTAPELFVVSEKDFKKAGSDPQLWTIAAKKHFASPNTYLL